MNKTHKDIQVHPWNKIIQEETTSDELEEFQKSVHELKEFIEIS